MPLSNDDKAEIRQLVREETLPRFMPLAMAAYHFGNVSTQTIRRRCIEEWGVTACDMVGNRIAWSSNRTKFIDRYELLRHAHAEPTS